MSCFVQLKIAGSEITQEATVKLQMAAPALKGIVPPKMKILSLITHPHIVPNP